MAVAATGAMARHGLAHMRFLCRAKIAPDEPRLHHPDEERQIDQQHEAGDDEGEAGEAYEGGLAIQRSGACAAELSLSPIDRYQANRIANSGNVRMNSTRYLIKVPEGEFDFLGYTFGRMYSAKTGQARLRHRPSKKSITTCG